MPQNFTIANFGHQVFILWVAKTLTQCVIASFVDRVAGKPHTIRSHVQVVHANTEWFHQYEMRFS